MKSLYTTLAAVLSSLALLVAGCAPSMSSVPTATGPVVLNPNLPLSQQVKVSPMPFEENGETPVYTITADIPTIIGVDDPRVKAFNDLTYGIFQLFTGEFRDAMTEMPATPITTGSSLDMRYTLVSPPGEIISIKYLVTGYSDGAAQPFHNVRTFSFNIETGQSLSITQLFLPDANYLQAFSDYCKAKLSTRNIGFEAFAFGADPLDENYKNWNITADGLLITFDEYQVAPYAAGPQEVTIPYSVLKDIIAPQGPLGRFIP